MKAHSENRALFPALISGFAWGLAEALFLFVVPDVLLCYWALKSPQKAVASMLAVVAGAMLGACFLYLALRISPGAYEGLHSLWGFFPGFKPKMAIVAHHHLLSGADGLLSGPSSGIPYRVYVLEAWKQGLPLLKILAWTPLARLERIVIAPIVVLALKFAVKKAVQPRFPGISWDRALAVLIVIYWILLYGLYWGKLVPALYGEIPPPAGAVIQKTLGENGLEHWFVRDQSIPALGEAWMDESGMVWGDILQNADGSIRYLNHYEATEYCQKIGAKLPSEGDFTRLRIYMGAKQDIYEGYQPQLLPNLFRKQGEKNLSNFFWSSTTEWLHYHLGYVFGGRIGGFGIVNRLFDDDFVSARCVVQK